MVKIITAECQADLYLAEEGFKLAFVDNYARFEGISMGGILETMLPPLYESLAKAVLNFRSKHYPSIQITKASNLLVHKYIETGGQADYGLIESNYLGQIFSAKDHFCDKTFFIRKMVQAFEERQIQNVKISDVSVNSPQQILATLDDIEVLRLDSLKGSFLPCEYFSSLLYKFERV